MPYTIWLKKNEEKRLLSGHGWVYANEAAKIEGKDKNGSLALVRAADGRFIGKGYINHASKILVRIFIRGGEEDSEELYERRIRAAWEYRKKLGYENCCRVVFGEADDLPALIVDKYADILVVQCLSLGIHQRKETICRVLEKIFSPRGIYERSDAAVRAKEGLPLEKGVLFGEVPDEVIIEENGLKMSVDVKNGQKTGYFLDQKENRFAVRRYAKGGTVLDCFCNSGGFSLNAALTADENLRFFFPGSRLQQRERALAAVGLAGYEDLPLSQLSAGQQRRVALTRLWLTDAPLWILDEPFTALDATAMETLTRRLEQHPRQGGSAILTTHQPLRPLGCPLRTLRLGGDGRWQ